MEDLSQQINQILSDPESMQQLQNMISSLGLNAPAQNDGQAAAAVQANPPPQPPPAGTPDLSALMGALGALGNAAQPNPQPTALQSLAGGDSARMLGMMTRLAPLLGQINREDESTRLLHALRPLLGAERQKKVDEALRILQMMRLLPLLKESGVFSGLLSGLM